MSRQQTGVRLIDLPRRKTIMLLLPPHRTLEQLLSAHWPQEGKPKDWSVSYEFVGLNEQGHQAFRVEWTRGEAL